MFKFLSIFELVRGQYDFGNLKTFVDRRYDYADGEYQMVDRRTGRTGSGDDAGLGFYSSLYDEDRVGNNSKFDQIFKIYFFYAKWHFDVIPDITNYPDPTHKNLWHIQK